MKYFLHSSSSFSDDKIAELYLNFGYEGLGLFYTILEKIALVEKPIKTEVLKHQLQVGKKLEKCWKFMESLEIICSNNGETFNEKILNVAEIYQEKREKNTKKIFQWREKQGLSENVTGYEPNSNQNVTATNPIEVNRTKDNIIKSAEVPIIEKVVKFKQPSLEEVKRFFTEKKSTEIDGEKFYNFYESNGWRVGKNKMQKWKASASNWIFNNRSPDKGKSGIERLAL